MATNALTSNQSLDTMNNVSALSYFAGYTTLSKYNHRNNMLTLSPPNASISSDLIRNVIAAALGPSNGGSSVNVVVQLSRDVVSIISEGPACKDRLAQKLTDMIAQFPHQLLRGAGEAGVKAEPGGAKADVEAERTFNVMFSYCLMSGCGGRYQYHGNELSSLKGDIESVITDSASNAAFILEYKYKNRTAVHALQQVKDKDFVAAYRVKGFKSVYGVGIVAVTKAHAVEVEMELLWSV